MREQIQGRLVSMSSPVVEIRDEQGERVPLFRTQSSFGCHLLKRAYLESVGNVL